MRLILVESQLTSYALTGNAISTVDPLYLCSLKKVA